MCCLCHQHNFHLSRCLLCWAVVEDCYPFPSEIRRVLHVHPKWRRYTRRRISEAILWHWSDSYQQLTSEHLPVLIFLYELTEGAEISSTGNGWRDVPSSSVYLLYIRKNLMLSHESKHGENMVTGEKKRVCCSLSAP